MKVIQYLNDIPSSIILACCAMASLAIGVIRYLTGPELALSLLFMFPVILSAWHGGMFHGVLIACLSALSWLAADLGMISRFSSPFIPFINEFFRLCVFLLVAVTMAAMKRVMDDHRKTARTDTLTHIPNRLSFHEYGTMEINKSRRDKRPISILFLDVDNFKTVNDTWGHQEGDRLLTEVAAALTQSIRLTDFAARLGGDEFAVLLWRSDSLSSLHVAEKIQTKLLTLAERKKWPVTFSMGLITYETVPESIHIMIDQADKLMYQAKEKGKNAIVSRIVDNGSSLETHDDDSIKEKPISL